MAPPIPTAIEEVYWQALLRAHPDWRAKPLNGAVVHVDATGRCKALRYVDSRGTVRYFRYGQDE